MHSLDDVPTVVKYPADVFRVNSARKMGVTVMTSVSARCADPLLDSEMTTVLRKRQYVQSGLKYIRTVLTSNSERLDPLSETPTRNSSRMKYLALVTLGSSPGSGVAERLQTHKDTFLSGVGSSTV